MLSHAKNPQVRPFSFYIGPIGNAISQDGIQQKTQTWPLSTISSSHYIKHCHIHCQIQFCTHKILWTFFPSGPFYRGPYFLNSYHLPLRRNCRSVANRIESYFCRFALGGQPISGNSGHFIPMYTERRFQHFRSHLQRQR